MEYGNRCEDALTYAAHLHRGQLRKGTSIPYVTRERLPGWRSL